MRLEGHLTSSTATFDVATKVEGISENTSDKAQVVRSSLFSLYLISSFVCDLLFGSTVPHSSLHPFSELIFAIDGTIFHFHRSFLCGVRSPVFLQNSTSLCISFHQRDLVGPLVFLD